MPLIELEIDGKKVPMNDYVRRVFENVIEALVSTLKGVDEDWRELKIEIKR